MRHIFWAFPGKTDTLKFKREAVQLYRSSGKKSIPKMAEELGIASESLRRWIRHHEIDEGVSAKVSPQTSGRSFEQAPPGEQDSQTGEREFLKKAAVFFAREGGTR